MQEHLIKRDQVTRVASEQLDEFRSIFLQPGLENSSLRSSVPYKVFCDLMGAIRFTSEEEGSDGL